jgi:hypothetical protein
VAAFGGSGVGGAAGMGQADLAARGQGAAGLARFLGEQPTALSGIQEPLVDLALAEGTGGDEVVEVAGRLPQLAVALADRGGGNPGQFLGQGRPRIAVTRIVTDGSVDRPGWSLEMAGLEPLEQHCGHLAGWGVEIAAGGPPVGVAGGVAAGWGDDIAAPAPPVHMGQADRVDVAEASGGEVVVPAGLTGADQRPEALQAMGGRQGADGLGAGVALEATWTRPRGFVAL